MEGRGMPRPRTAYSEQPNVELQTMIRVTDSVLLIQSY